MVQGLGSSCYQKVAGLIPGPSGLHVKASLGKKTEPKIAPDGSAINVSVSVSDEQVALCIQPLVYEWVNVDMQCEVL